MKTYLHLFIALFFSTAVNSQFVEWSKDLETYDAEDYIFESNEINRVFSIQLTGGDLLIIRNNTITADEEFMKFGTRYDSVCFTRVKSTTGAVVFRKSLAYTGRGKIYAAAATSDSGFVCCGVQANFLSLFKLDKNGNLETLKQWPKPVQKIYPCNIAVGPDNNYYMLTAEFYYKSCVSNMIWYYQTVFDVYYNLIKVDATGNINWIKAAGSDIVLGQYQMAIQPNCDSITIRDIPIYTMMDAIGSSINLVSSSPYSYNPANGYSKRGIYLKKFDINGNTLLQKTLIDSITPARNTSEDIYITYGFSLQNDLSRTGNGYLFSFQGGYIPDYPISNDSSYEVNYHQTFDGNGNKLDSIVEKSVHYWWDLSPRNYANKPVLKDAGGKYWSLKSISWEDSYNFEGNYVLMEFNDSFRISKQVDLSDHSANADLAPRQLYQAPDGGMLLVYIKSYRDNSPLGPYGEAIHVAKTGPRGNSIHYHVFTDNNRNGVFDAGDSKFSNALLQVGHHQHSRDYPYSNGQMVYSADTGTYTSRLISYYQYLRYYDIIPIQATTTFSTFGNRDTVTFRLLPRPGIQDLQVNITPINTARPGLESRYTLLVSNYGTDTAWHFPVKFLKDPRQQFISANTDGYVIRQDTLIWMIDSLAPDENWQTEIVCENAIPPALDANDTLQIQAFVLPLETDSAKADNYFLLKEAVRNSADPNDKLEAHGAGITPSQLVNRDYLYYTIRFQNTGNDYAYKIVIKDTLSNLLDWNTFEMLSSSHTYNLEITDNHFVTWSFINIYLIPAVWDEPSSHGYITFRIRPKAGLSVSDVIPNRASIIFDFNQAIVTNTATTQILQERVTLVKNNEIRSIKIYPSPTYNLINLEMDIREHGHYDLLVTDLTGKIVRQKTLDLYTGKNLQQIAMGGFPAGMYLISLSQDDAVLYLGKMLKE